VGCFFVGINYSFAKKLNALYNILVASKTKEYMARFTDT